MLSDQTLAVTEPTNSRIDEWFRLDNAAKLSVRAVGKSRLAVTEIRYDAPNFGVTEDVEPVDAFLVALRLKPASLVDVWYQDKARPLRDVRAGDVHIFDLKSVKRARYVDPLHSLQFFLPRGFLDGLCDDLEAPRIEQLRVTPDSAWRDPVVRRLGNCVQPALAAPHEVNELFASQIMLSFGIYVCAIKGGLCTPRRHQGGLSAWQERTAKAVIDAHIDGGVPLEFVAATCGLSSSHFAHAFKNSVGMAPHKWLLRRRVERATELLRRSRDSLTDIALSCGFADQSHFTRVFRRATGQSPGMWKQMLQ